jgi:hypothetical protein
MTCDHRGIGLPGCPTCDGRLDPETIKDRFALNNYVGFLLATLAHTERTVKEAQRIIEERAAEPKEPHGIGPWTRVGGPMPEPWPTMAVSLDTGRGPCMTSLDPIVPRGDGTWWATGVRGVTVESSEVCGVWDGRSCIWRRE